MKVTKKVIGNLEKCYCVAPLVYKGEKHLLVAAEKINQCRMYDLEGNLEDVIWDEPGGTMSMVQVPGTDGQFLATHKFYSPNDSKEAKIMVVTPKDGKWDIKTLAELPFVHRFDIISRNGINYLIACTIKSDHEYKEDWRTPGKVYATKLPEDLTQINEENLLKLEVLKDGLLKNHGYCKTEMDGVLCSIVAAEEGVFQFVPPTEDGGSWEVKQILNEPASDMAFADFNGDGNKEMLTISPFHGDKIFVYQLQDGAYKKIYTYENDMEFAHGIWGGKVCGKEGVIIGHRKAERNLAFFSCTDPANMVIERELIDENIGPANVLYYENNGKNYILSANREIDEIALYEVE